MHTLYEIVENGKRTYFNGYGSPMSIGTTIMQAIHAAGDETMSMADAMRKLSRITPMHLEELDDGGHFLYTWDSENSGYGHNSLDQHICYNLDKGLVTYENSIYTESMVKKGQWFLPCDIRADVLSMQTGRKLDSGDYLRVHDITSSLSHGYMTVPSRTGLPDIERNALSIPLASSFTAYGKESNSDIFLADVKYVKAQHYGQPLYNMIGVSPDRFDEFAGMINCNNEQIEEHRACLRMPCWAINARPHNWMEQITLGEYSSIDEQRM